MGGAEEEDVAYEEFVEVFKMLTARQEALLCAGQENPEKVGSGRRCCSWVGSAFRAVREAAGRLRREPRHRAHEGYSTKMKRTTRPLLIEVASVLLIPLAL
eukprot:RCo047198